MGVDIASLGAQSKHISQSLFGSAFLHELHRLWDCDYKGLVWRRASALFLSWKFCTGASRNRGSQVIRTLKQL